MSIDESNRDRMRASKRFTVPVEIPAYADF